eukprot:4871425-Heterocapsa_arctica.AAC.1
MTELKLTAQVSPRVNLDGASSFSSCSVLQLLPKEVKDDNGNKAARSSNEFIFTSADKLREEEASRRMIEMERLAFSRKATSETRIESKPENLPAPKQHVGPAPSKSLDYDKQSHQREALEIIRGGSRGGRDTKFH